MRGPWGLRDFGAQGKGSSFKRARTYLQLDFNCSDIAHLLGFRPVVFDLFW